MRPIDTFEALTFDCYGTIIDWETGLIGALSPILAGHGIDPGAEALLERFGAFEAEEEQGVYRPYREILSAVLKRFGKTYGFRPTAAELAQFPRSVGDWPPFPDSTSALLALKRKYRLAIVSNIDDDLFALTAKRLGVPFDWVITAQQNRVYKPSPEMFQKAFAAIGARPEGILHVAQSLYHDIAPVRALGIATVWIDRRHGRKGAGATPPVEATPDLSFPDLKSLAEYAGVM